MSVVFRPSSMKVKDDNNEYVDVNILTGNTEQAIFDWLDDHPEATTTVQDGSITSEKLSSELRAEIANASSDVQDGAITKSKFSDDLVIAKIDNYASPMDFGAVGDGVADDTAAFVAAEASEKTIIYVPKGVYKVSGITTTKSIIMDSEAWFTTDTDRIHMVSIAGDNQIYSLNIRGKNTYARAGVYISGNHNHFQQIIIDGLNYDGVNIYPNLRVNSGVIIAGSYNTFDFVRMNDFVQDLAGNDSAPQGISIDRASATHNYIANFFIDNCRAGVVNAGLPGTTNGFGTISVHGCGDNGVYCVGGGHTEIGTLLHHGTNECLAVITDGATASTSDSELSSVDVGTIVTKGEYDFPLRIKNAGKINVGSFFIRGTINAIIFVNAENVRSAGINIDSINFDGSATYGFFLPESRGELDYLDLGRVKIKDDHKRSKLDLSASDTYYFIVSMVKNFRLENLDVEISDNESAYGATVVRLRILVNTSVKDSYIGNIGLTFDSSMSGGSLDVINAAQGGLTLTHGQFLNDDSSNMLRIYGDNRYKRGLFSRLQPQYGTWRAGTVLYTDREQTVAAGTIGFVCVSAGTPGTWREIKMYPYSGAVRYDSNKLQAYSGSWSTGSWSDISVS